MRRTAEFVTLGTVQLGQLYGLGKAGAAGLTEAEVMAVLDAAAAAGITSFDTARAYGESEARLGRWRRLNMPATPLRIVSKIGSLGSVSDDEVDGVIRRDLGNSLAALGLPSLDGLLTHNARDIQSVPVAAALRGLVKAGLIKAFGASVYTPEEAAQTMHCAGLSLLQLPASILNQAVLDSDILSQARHRGITVGVRSVYTQGLVFLDPELLPAHLQSAAPILRQLRGLARETGHDLAALALAPLIHHPAIDTLVIGCDTPEQVYTAVRHVTQSCPPADIAAEVLRICRGLPPEICDPRLWPSEAV